MSLIYEPKGKAREYSPLAINLYSGCGHKCSYCYVPDVLRIERKTFDTVVKPKENILSQIKREIPKYKYSDKQIFMSFTTDPYNPIDEVEKLTREALKLFYENKIPVSILTKSGLKALRDIDIIKKFGKHIKIGASLTYDNSIDSNRIERGAAIPEERLKMLEIFYSEGIRTWVSFEPILQPEQTLNLLKKSIAYVNEYQLGMLSGDKREYNWNLFLKTAVGIMRENKREFYIKETLRKSGNVLLNEKEYDMDYLTLKKFENIQIETLFG